MMKAQQQHWHSARGSHVETDTEVQLVLNVNLKLKNAGKCHLTPLVHDVTGGHSSGHV